MHVDRNKRCIDPNKGTNSSKFLILVASIYTGSSCSDKCFHGSRLRLLQPLATAPLDLTECLQTELSWC